MNRVLNRSDDGGFSVFEVVIAASILFFAITAILGLVATTTDMGINARRRNLATNVISSRMEHYRSLPFARIALYPTGDVLPNETITEEGYTITLTTSVRSGTQPGTREIKIIATVSAEGRPAYSMTAFTIVRDRDIDFTTAAQNTGKPIVRFGPSSPARNSVVYDDRVAGGLEGSLRFHVIAESPDVADPIQEMRLDCGGPLRDTPFSNANKALWTYTGSESTREEYFTWHTRSTDPTISDGWQKVTFAATNEKGTASTTRDFYVDNYPPDTPASLVTVTPTSNVANTLKWTLCQDGAPGNYAAWYDLQVWELTGSSPSLPETSTVYEQITDVRKAVPTLGFSRYHAAVRSVSTLANTNGWCQLSPAPFVSRPLASGDSTYVPSVIGSFRWDRTTVHISAETPRFPVYGKVVYRLYRRKAPQTAGSEVLVPGSTKELTPTVAYTYDDYITYVGSKQTAYLPYYYYVSAEFVPVGYGSTGASETVLTNRLGPTSTNTSLTPLPLEGW